MTNINPWLVSGVVLTLSAITFRGWFGNSMVSVLLALMMALSVVPLVKVLQAKNKAGKDFQTYKLVGALISILGLAISAYFNIFSLTSPNPRLALAGSVIFAIGLAIILVNRHKNQTARNKYN